MNSAQAYQQYKKSSIESSNPNMLIIKLYEGGIKFLNMAEIKMEEKDYQESNNLLIRVQRIILELRYSLDEEKGGELAKNLADLYDYMYGRLITANLEKKIEIIDEVRGLLKELLEAWQEAVKKAQKTNGLGLKAKV